MPVEELLNAAKSNDFKAFSIYLILEEDADVNAKDREGWTLLHYAVINGNIDMVKTLLKNGADPTQVTSEGDIPLHVACRKGSKEIVDVLLKHASVYGINYVDANTALHGDTPLHIAAKNGFTDIVKSLLSHGAIYDIKNKENQTPTQLSRASTVTKVLDLIQESFEKAEAGDNDIINILQNASPEEFTVIMKARNCKNRPLIHEAMANHRYQLTAKLLKMNVDSHLNDVDDPLFTIDSTESSTKEKLKLWIRAYSYIYLPIIIIIIALYLYLSQESFEKVQKSDIDIINLDPSPEYLPSSIIDEGIHLPSSIIDEGLHLPSSIIDEGKHLSSLIIDEGRLKLLKEGAEINLQYSDVFISILRDMVYDSDENSSPYMTVRGGSSILDCYQDFINSYKNLIPGKLEDEDIKLVHDALVRLQFDGSHITYEACVGDTKCFVSKGQGTVYYNMLHSDLNQDVRLFIDFVEKNLDPPVRRFLETVNQKLKMYS